MKSIKTREEIDNKYKWDLSVIFKNEKEFNDLYEETKELINIFKKYENHVMDNSDTLLEVIEVDIEISRRIDKLYSYASMKSDEDVSNNKNQELVGRVVNLYDLDIKNSYFVKTEMLKEDYSKIEKFYKDNSKLLEYEKYINLIL